VVCLFHCSGISKKRGKEEGERLEFDFPPTNRQPVLVLAALVFPLLSHSLVTRHMLSDLQPLPLKMAIKRKEVTNHRPYTGV
jgi:hypothetical protein